LRVFANRIELGNALVASITPTSSFNRNFRLSRRRLGAEHCAPFPCRAITRAAIRSPKFRFEAPHENWLVKTGLWQVKARHTPAILLDRKTTVWNSIVGAL
jgi:hypothetical protein